MLRSSSRLVIPALLLLALLPGIGVLGRYALAAYLPGLIVWRALRPAADTLLDQIVLPSLFSILPFCWIVMAGRALGLDPLTASWTGVLPFLAAGLARGVGSWPIVERQEAAIVAGIAALAGLTVALPLAANGFSAGAWDGPLHGAIAMRALTGTFPPDSAIVAGQPVGYYWLYHLYTAALSELTGLSLYQVFALVDVHAFLLFGLAGLRLAKRLTLSLPGRLAAVALLVFGLNPFGWLLFLRAAAAEPESWQALVVPVKMVSGYPGQLGSLVHQFLDGNPFALGFPFWLLWLERVVAWTEGERDRASFLTGALALAGALYLHLFSGGFLLAASALAALPSSARRGLFAMMGGSVLVVLPYAANVVREKTRAPVRLDLAPAFVGAELLALVASLGLLVVLAAPALRGGAAGRSVLVRYVFVLGVAALVVRTPANTQYKLLYLMLPGLAMLAGCAWDTWRTTLGPAFFSSALALALPTNLLTSLVYAARPPRESVTLEQRDLHDWIRESTPAESVFVDDHTGPHEGLSETQLLFRDHEWFQIPIHGRRRTLVGYTEDVLAGEWGYRDIPRRKRLAADLVQARPLRPWQREVLRTLIAPVYVVVRDPTVDAARSAGAGYSLAYDRFGTRVLHVVIE